jgi:putative transposase
MARPLRLHLQGFHYHVMSRGNARQAIFLDDRDYRTFLRLLSRALARFEVRCQAYCLMPNHFHLLLQPHAHALSRVMQQVNSAYAGAFNRRHGQVGHVLQGRFKALVIGEERYFRQVVRYIVTNPVRGCGVADPAAWPWSSYRATVGLASAPRFLDLPTLWRHFDAQSRRRAREAVALFVARADEAPDPPGPVFFGSADLAARIDEHVAAERANPEHAKAVRFAVRPALGALIDGDGGAAALDLRMGRAFLEHGYTLREIAVRVGLHTSTVWKRIHRGRPPGPKCRSYQAMDRSRKSARFCASRMPCPSRGYRSMTASTPTSFSAM